MNDIERIGVGIDTTGIEAGTAALDKLADAGPKVDAALRTVEGAVAKTGKSLASLGAGSGDGLTEAAQKMDRAASTITEVVVERRCGSASASHIIASKALSWLGPPQLRSCSRVLLLKLVFSLMKC